VRVGWRCSHCPARVPAGGAGSDGLPVTPTPRQERHDGLAAGWPAGSVRWATTPVVIDGPAKSTYKPGKMITFCHWNLTTDVVTHRVAELRDGFTHTKGDANRTADVWDIGPNQVQGIVVMKLPHRGYLLVFLRRPAGIASPVIGGLALMLLRGLCNPSTQKRAPSKSASKPAPSTPPRLPPYRAARRERPETCRTARPSRPGWHRRRHRWSNRNPDA
jgi:hypothetical protein